MTELMVGVGLLGGVSLVTMKLMQENASNDTYIRFRAEVSKATALIQTHLADPNSCKTMLVGKTRHLSPAVPAGALQYFNGTGNLTMTTKSGTTMSLLQHGQTYDGFSIPTGGIILAVNPTYGQMTDLILVFDIKKRDIAARKDGTSQRIIKKITLKTEQSPADTGTTINGCGPIVADANNEAKQILCASLTSGAAYWDTSTTPPECRLRAIRCPFGQVPFQMTSLGSIQCIPVEQKIDNSEIFEFGTQPCAPGQSVKLESTGAPAYKIRAVCY